MLLALQLGMTLHELGDRMTGEEFGLWCALYRTDPWGEQRADLRSGIVAAQVANYAGKMRGKHAAPAKPSDFMPYIQQSDESGEVEREPDPMQHFGALARG
jgi:hypothetical protein